MALSDKILAALEQSRGTPLSGQALAERFGVSRGAVWKGVNALKSQGYAIASATNRGYTLAAACDKLSAAGVRAFLPPALAGVPVFVYESVDSTNSEARRLRAGGQTGSFIVLAEQQTAGRGRRGRIFCSPAGGLYLSVALACEAGIAEALPVTAYAAVSAVEAVREVCGVETGIKWVNDLYKNGRKVGGILTEAAADFESGTVTSLIVGVGLNLRAPEIADFPPELAEIAGALGCGEEAVKNRLGAALAARLLAYTPGSTAHMAHYRAYSLVLGRAVAFEQGGQRFTGTAVRIGDDGALYVRTENGETALRSGEISLRLEEPTGNETQNHEDQ